MESWMRGIKMSLLQMTKTEEEEPTNLSEICVQHHVWTHTHHRYYEYFQQTFEHQQIFINTTQRTISIRCTFQYLFFCISFLYSHSLMIKYLDDVRTHCKECVRRKMQIETRNMTVNVHINYTYIRVWCECIYFCWLSILVCLIDETCMDLIVEEKKLILKPQMNWSEIGRLAIVR